MSDKPDLPTPPVEPPAETTSAWASPTAPWPPPYSGTSESLPSRSLPGEPLLAEPLPAEPLREQRRRRRSIVLVTAGAMALIVGGASLAAIGVYSAISDATDSSSESDPGVDGELFPGHTVPGPDGALASLDVTPATADQMVGVVTIVSDLYYSGDTWAAGTGSILTAGGRILTNNHVIEGSTEIEVTVESTGKTYFAEVVGTDPTNDVALLQVVDAPALDPVELDLEQLVAVDDEVTSIGNADGTGELVAAEGLVTAVDRWIDIASEYSTEGGRLTRLIEIDADVVPGDSGGPLLDTDGEVIGMVTAGSTSRVDIIAYAITIAVAMAIVDQIEAGDESGTVLIGAPAFLGIEVGSDESGDGVLLENVVDGQAADRAGIEPGDTITSVNGIAVNLTEDIRAIILALEPGDEVTVDFIDSAGVAISVIATLGEGPAA